jgi:dTDP-4-amino-4,6-dideoxygalactose transaminase
VGARPVFADINPDTFNIDPARIEGAVTPRTRAVIPVHLFGQMADMKLIMEIAQRRGLSVVEDVAQAIGASQDGQMAGSFGATGCLSFYPTKNLGAIGDAGMVVTNDEKLAEKLAVIRNHGQSGTYEHKWIGGNFRMADVQAAALLVKLKHLGEWIARRRQLAGVYRRLLGDFDRITLPKVRPGNEHVFNYYVIRSQRRDELAAFLKKNGVATAVYYPLCLHEQECFAPLGYKRGDFPRAEQAAREVLALPMYPEMTDEQAAYTAGKIREFFG